MMKSDTMKKDSMMMATGMMKDDKTKDMKMMTGEKTEWTKEEMEAMEKDHMMMSGSDMKMDSMKKEEMMKLESMMKPADTMMKMSGYMNYDEAKVKSALASWQKVVLFFHAAWCPTCKALDATINSSLALIPQDALIVKVDYDNSDALKKKYGVTSQHTTVLIDKDMNLVSKKLGARSVSEVLN
jgi:thioredoxin 1